MSEKSKTVIFRPGIILSVALSFIISFADFSVLYSPFSIALAAAVSPVYSAAMAAGGVLSYILISGMRAAPFAAALAVAAVMRIALKKSSAMISALITGVSIFLSFVLHAITASVDAGTVIAYIFSLAGACTVSYYVFVLMNSPRGVADEAASNPAVLAALCFMIISVSSSFSFFGINIGEILAALVVLIYARNYRFAGGGTAGVLAAFTLMLNGFSDAGCIVFMGLAGTVAGTFVNFGRPAAASSYVITAVLSSVPSGIDREQILSYICMAAGALIFCFIPVEKIHNEQKRISGSYDDGSEMTRMISFRMKQAADALEDIASSVYSIMTEKKMPLPGYAYAGCTAETENAVGNRLIDVTADEYIRMSRGVLYNQLNASSEILKDISHNASSVYTVDKRVTERMKRCFLENDIGFSSVVAYYNSGGRLFAEIYCTKNACISGYRIYKTLCSEFGKSFECTKCYDGEEMRFLISERPGYNVETDICQKSSVKNHTNGDTCDCFRDDYGNVYMVISDGMGTGDEASEYSRMAVSYFRRLILGGVDITQCIRIINSMLLTRKADECFATLDVVKIDLDTGGMTVYKSGAAPTLFRHNGSVFSVSSSTYPLGISEEYVPYSKSLALRVGDAVAMISDGVPEEAYGIIRRELNENKDISTISENICRIAGKISNDDISVIAARLIRQ